MQGSFWAITLLVTKAYSSFDCSFNSTYPKQYVAHRAKAVTIDGVLDDQVWKSSKFTDDFVDISTTVVPRFKTNVKMAWDDDYLYIGAVLEEPDIWANITSVCHCNNSTNDQVIFHDNDFEVFVDADGSTHNYKEFEMNAANQDWVLLLNRPYADGGGENSTRVYGSDGFDIVGRKHAVSIKGKLNDINSVNKQWSVEIAFPLQQLYQLTAASHPKDGDFWRINFSRVEYHVAKEFGEYVKTNPVEDNWVWSPQGEIAMHLPERWGILQFSTSTRFDTPPKYHDEWQIRSIAMELYYNLHSFRDANGFFTNDVSLLNNPAFGCAGSIFVANSTDKFTGYIDSADQQYYAVIDDLRFLQVFKRE
ncbi:hypothetical protein HDV04_003985 [Boothiomyces sp. JEL0838]|nr:hypothetical protein HDV04_003985 [Boothiomyces sp. JEL0838]